jgi:hypothetical protein
MRLENPLSRNSRTSFDRIEHLEGLVTHVSETKRDETYIKENFFREISLLNVLKTLESNINAHMGLVWGEAVPAASPDKLRSTAWNEPRPQRAKVDEDQLAQRRQQNNLDRVKIERDEKEQKAKTFGDLKLNPGHYYEFKTATTTCNMYFICAISLDRLVFSSSSYDKILNYAVGGKYSASNPETWIVHKMEIKNIHVVSDRPTVDVRDLPEWIQASRI